MIRLQKEREAKGLSRKALAESARVTQGQISKAERGMQFYPAEIVRLADALGFQGDPSELLDEAEL